MVPVCLPFAWFEWTHGQGACAYTGATLCPTTREKLTEAVLLATWATIAGAVTLALAQRVRHKWTARAAGFAIMAATAVFSLGVAFWIGEDSRPSSNEQLIVDARSAPNGRWQKVRPSGSAFECVAAVRLTVSEREIESSNTLTFRYGDERECRDGGRPTLVAVNLSTRRAEFVTDGDVVLSRTLLGMGGGLLVFAVSVEREKRRTRRQHGTRSD